MADSTSKRPDLDYLQDLSTLIPIHHPLQKVISSSDAGQCRTFYTDRKSQVPLDLPALLAYAEDERIKGLMNVCLIENINATYIGHLGASWDIPPEFFIQHASSPDKRPLWNTVMGRRLGTTETMPIDPMTEGRCHHVKGVMPYVSLKDAGEGMLARQTEYDSAYGGQIFTKISYIRVRRGLYLFLADRPYTMEPAADERLRPSKLELWLPFGRNYGGLPIPQLYYQDTFSMYDILRTFLGHPWHLRMLYSDTEPTRALHPGLFAYLLAASTWRTNIRWLDQDVKKVAFYDIRQPTIAINNRLHDRRHDLNTLRYSLAMIKTWLSPELEKNFQDLVADNLGRMLGDVLQSAEELDKFLMDTFQLLMSSMSVLDSAASIQQTRRGTLLTQLAAIYLPVSLVTGVFGMNVAGLSGVPAWSCVVALVIILLCTAVLLWAMRSLPILDPGNMSRDRRTK